MKKLILLLFFIISCSPISQTDIKNKTPEPEIKNSITDKKESIKIIPEYVNIETGSSLQLYGYIENRSRQGLIPLLWKSSDENIIKVDSSGFIYAIAEGNATLNVSTFENDLPSGKTLNVKVNIKVIPVNASAFESITPQPTPTCGPTDLCTKSTVYGNIFDEENNPVNDVKVIARSIAPHYKWNLETLSIENGFYVMRNLQPGIIIQISLSKEGYKPINRSMYVIDPILTSAQNVNQLNFGGIVNPHDLQFTLKKN